MNKLNYFNILALRDVIDLKSYSESAENIAKEIINAFENGNRVYWFGNGGSAADAQHLAAEFSGRFLKNRKALPSEALNCNVSALTAISNDFGYENLFSRQVEAFVASDDVVIGITTSGNSPNVVNGLSKANELGARTVAFTGNGGGKVSDIAKYSIIGPSGISAIIQEVHITVGHIICHLVDQHYM